MVRPDIIDVTLIPDVVRDSIAKATLAAVTEFLEKPGSREFLDAVILEKGWDFDE